MDVASSKTELPASARERVLFLLKRDGPQAVARLALQLGVSSMAVRQQLALLSGEGLVAFSDEPRRIGRPARVWRLTAKADARFPDRHGALAVDLLQGVQSAFGEAGLQRLTDGWTRKQLAAYRAQMPATDLPLAQRVAALVRIRSAEGFMAECRPAEDGEIGRASGRERGWMEFSRVLSRPRAQRPATDLPLAQRVAALVRIRSAEGFMAECRPAEDG